MWSRMSKKKWGGGVSACVFACVRVGLLFFIVENDSVTRSASDVGRRSQRLAVVLPQSKSRVERRVAELYLRSLSLARNRQQTERVASLWSPPSVLSRPGSDAWRKNNSKDITGSHLMTEKRPKISTRHRGAFGAGGNMSLEQIGIFFFFFEVEIMGLNIDGALLRLILTRWEHRQGSWHDVTLCLTLPAILFHLLKVKKESELLLKLKKVRIN